MFKVTRMFLAVLIAAGVTAWTGPASAATGQTSHYKLYGASAIAIWQHGNTITFMDGESDNQFGTDVSYDSFTPHFGAHGNFTGGVDVSGDAFGSHASITVGKLLGSAQVTATIRVRRCIVKPNGSNGTCGAPTRITIDLTFTGYGPTAHGGSNDRFHAPGVTITDHQVGTQRLATATGTIGGQTMLARDLQVGEIGQLKGGGLYLCHGCI
jgi:hypothetical protein